MVGANSGFTASRFIGAVAVPFLFIAVAVFGWRAVMHRYAEASFGSSLVAWCMWFASPALSAIIATFYYPRRAAFSGYRVAFAAFVSYSVAVVALFVVLNAFARR